MKDNLGWILLYRKIRSSILWPTNRSFTEMEAWIDLLLLAEYEPTFKRYKSRSYELQRGDVFASIRFLAKRWNWSIGKVHRFVSFLKSEHKVERKVEHLEQVLTICNYEEYQNAATTYGTEKGTQYGTKKERKRNKMKESKEAKEINTYAQSFEQFWSEYPRKVRKQKACQIWVNMIMPSDELFQKIISGLRRQKESKQWKNNAGQYIPYPITWLNEHRWEDVIESEGQKWDEI